MTIPDGRNEAIYSRLGNENYRRFAWEFLRRNLRFQGDCMAVEAGREKSEDIAMKWGLKRFKDYRESHSKPRNVVFDASRVRFYSRDFKETRRIKLRLAPGEVAVVFDLNDLKKYRQAFDAKLIYAALGLKRRLKLLLEEGGKPKRIKLLSNNLSRYLRVFDLRKSGMKPSEIRDLVHADTKHVKGHRYYKDDHYSVENDLRAAKKHIRNYLELAVRHYADKDLPAFSTRETPKKAR